MEALPKLTCERLRLNFQVLKICVGRQLNLNMLDEAHI